jgi:hypothetical protein
MPFINAIHRARAWLVSRSTFDDVGAGPAETAAIIAGLVVAALAVVAAVQAFAGDQMSVLGG